jgi:hypothetical protein
MVWKEYLDREKRVTAVPFEEGQITVNARAVRNTHLFEGVGGGIFGLCDGLRRQARGEKEANPAVEVHQDHLRPLGSRCLQNGSAY